MFVLSSLLFSQVNIDKAIKTATTTPIRSPAYIIAVHIEVKFKEKLDNFLADGITEESDSYGVVHLCQ